MQYQTAEPAHTTNAAWNAPVAIHAEIIEREVNLVETTFTYPKPIMKMSALIDMGFPEEFLLYAYRNPRQTFAHKMNPTKKNSPILFETAGFEAWRQKLIKTEVQSMPRGTS